MTKEQLLDIRAHIKLIEIHAQNLKKSLAYNQQMGRILKEVTELRQILDKAINDSNKEQIKEIIKK